MGTRQASLTYALLIGLSAAHARADSADASVPGQAARIRRPMVPIPSDGAILIESPAFALPTVVVFDGEGNRLEGTLHEVGIGIGPLMAWVPDSPFPIGQLDVELYTDDPQDEAFASIEVVASLGRVPPELKTEPSALWQGTPFEDACCSTPFSAPASCFWVAEEATVRVLPGFSTSETQAVLNQYLFRVVERGADFFPTEPIFRPLESPHEVAFTRAADSYCIDVHALRIATQQVHVYEGLEGCTTHANKRVGLVDIELDPANLAPETCPVPPYSHRDEWCVINDKACDEASTYECQLYHYVCSDGPLPDAWAQIIEELGSVDGGTRDPRAGWPSRGDAGVVESDGGIPLDGGRDAPDAEPPAEQPSDASVDRRNEGGGCSAGSKREGLGSLPALFIALVTLCWRRRLARLLAP